jgi:hypothetical protein
MKPQESHDISHQPGDKSAQSAILKLKANREKHNMGKIAAKALFQK